jgi:hypothetical protein
MKFNLETSVGRGKDMQDHSSIASCNRCVSASMHVIGVHGESEKRVVTLLVMRGFFDLPGAPRACVDFRDPTEVSRFNQSTQGT